MSMLISCLQGSRVDYEQAWQLQHRWRGQVCYTMNTGDCTVIMCIVVSTAGQHTPCYLPDNSNFNVNTAPTALTFRAYAWRAVVIFALVVVHRVGTIPSPSQLFQFSCGHRGDARDCRHHTDHAGTRCSFQCYTC
jgi:hypothetical protein